MSDSSSRPRALTSQIPLEYLDLSSKLSRTAKKAHFTNEKAQMDGQRTIPGSEALVEDLRIAVPWPAAVGEKPSRPSREAVIPVDLLLWPLRVHISAVYVPLWEGT